MSRSQGCLWPCAEGKKEMGSELQVYKLKTGACAPCLRWCWRRKCIFSAADERRAREGKGQGVGSSPQGRVRDSLVPCSRQSLAPLSQLPLAVSKSLMKLELLESVTSCAYYYPWPLQNLFITSGDLLPKLTLFLLIPFPISNRRHVS